MLSAILWILAALIAVALLAVLLPIRVRLAARSDPAPRLRVDVRPLAGLSPWIAVFDSDRKTGRDVTGDKPPVAERNHGDRKPKPRRRRRKGKRTWPVRRMLNALPDLLSGLIRVFRIDRLDFEGQVGLDDPADTGTAYGMVAPVIHGAQGLWPGRVRVALVPVFDGPCLEGRAEAEISVVPFRVVPAALCFAWASLGPAR